MDFRPNPLLYGANEDFLSSFKLAVTMCSEVDHGALSRAVAGAMVRYPYFSVSPEREGNDIVLRHNSRPVPVFGDGRCVVLGSEESNRHLLAFGCTGRQILLHASHCIADGMGIDPLLKTVLYLYVSELYGTEGLQAERIPMPDSPVGQEEYAYPFFEEPREVDFSRLPRSTPSAAHALDPAAFDGDGLYAYHLRVPQRAMMKLANPSDGSPVSFLSVMLYRAICALDGELSHPVVAHVQHQYRAVLGAPRNKHSLVSYVPVSLPPRARTWDLERQNTVIRGQVIIGSEPDADLNAINRLIRVLPREREASLGDKRRAMQKYIEDSIRPKTFGISYVGRMDWCGLDRYVEDLHAYIGEKHTDNMLLIEVMTVGEDFTINFMQSGKGRRYLDAFVGEILSLGIPIRVIGEDRYTLCDTRVPDGEDA